MAVNLAPTFGAGYQAFGSTNIPLSGGFIYTYAAGTTTPQATYTSSSGSVANSNPIVLNADGRPPSEIWLTGGLTYKFSLFDSNSNLIATYDNLIGINDIAISGSSEWIGASTPTYISATSFSVVGTQTLNFTPNRRMYSVNTGGTIYSTVLTSVAAGGITTVTVVNDSGVLDSGLSAVNYAVLNSTHPSMPPYLDVMSIVQDVLDPTKLLQITTSSLATSTTAVMTIQGSGVFPVAPSPLFPFSASTTANALTGKLSSSLVSYRNATLTTGGGTDVSNAVLSCTIPATSNLGMLLTGQSQRLAWMAASNSGASVLCVANMTGVTSINIDETTLISPTTIGASSNSANVIYSATAVGANSPFRVIGFTDVVFSTGTGWSAPTTVQPAGGMSMVNLVLSGQQWQSVTRTSGTTYYNLTGRPIKISVTVTLNGSSTTTLTINGQVVGSQSIGTGYVVQIYGEIGINASYVVTDAGSNSHTTTEYR